MKVQVNNRSTLCCKLILVGICLPILDVSTDIMTIYKHWNSKQWILQFLAKTLLLTMIFHNITASFYSISYHIGDDVKFKQGRTRKIFDFLCSALGVHNVQITVDILKQTLGNGQFDSE